MQQMMSISSSLSFFVFFNGGPPCLLESLGLILNIWYSHHHYSFAKDASLSIFDFWGYPYGLWVRKVLHHCIWLLCMSLSQHFYLPLGFLKSVHFSSASMDDMINLSNFKLESWNTLVIAKLYSFGRGGAISQRLQAQPAQLFSSFFTVLGPKPKGLC